MIQSSPDLREPAPGPVALWRLFLQHHQFPQLPRIQRRGDQRGDVDQNPAGAFRPARALRMIEESRFVLALWTWYGYSYSFSILSTKNRKTY